MPVTSEPTSESLLKLVSLSVSRRGEHILDNIDLQVSRGEIVTLVGPNGAGKSTLVETALGLSQPTSGRVIRSRNLRIGYVPQSIDIDETLPISVRRFLSIAANTQSQAVQNPVEQILMRVNATELADRQLNLISGGEMRRVILARALLTQPDLLILDEPTSGVDLSGQSNLYQLIQDIRDQYQCGVLLVSHNLHVVMAASDRVVCLNRHLCCSGTPEDVQQHPEFVSLFGQQGANALGIYRHEHDHEHDLHGNVHPSHCNH